jgi:hypothetical protein
MLEMTNRNKEMDKDANRDPITGAAGSHPIGTGVGAAAGGIAGGIGAGALAGSVGGPVGVAVGAVVGAVAGGLAGKGVAEAIDPTVEDTYWRANYANRPYVGKGASFDDYGPAYRLGVDSYGRSNGRTFKQSEADLERSWETAKGTSSLSWDEAKDASRDSWQRVSNTIERAVPGDSDRDGM